MVVKRQCTFCAGEIEPGTGTLYVKRDGSVFQFCSSSCRKQQLHLGRVGHRLRWTRAHAMKRAAEHSSATARGRTAPAPAEKARPKPKAPVQEATPPVPATETAKPAPSTSPAPTPEATSTPPKSKSRRTEGASSPGTKKPAKKVPQPAETKGGPG